LLQEEEEEKEKEASFHLFPALLLLLLFLPRLLLLRKTMRIVMEALESSFSPCFSDVTKAAAKSLIEKNHEDKGWNEKKKILMITLLVDT